MNIIIANDQEINPQIGGVERDSSLLAKKFVSLGHNVYFIACKVSPYSKIYIPTVDQIFLPNHINLLSMENIYFFQDFVMQKKIDIIMNQAADILDFSLLCFEVAKRSKIKLVSVVHYDPHARINQLSDFSKSILRVKNLPRRIMKRLIFPFRYLKIKQDERNNYREIYLNCNKVVLISQYFVSPFLKLTRFPESDKVVAILNPVSDELKSYKVNRKKQILYVGRINYFQKRTDRIIEIWEKIYTRFPEWGLVVVGEGPLLKDLQEYVSENNIDRVSFKGISDPNIHYQESEILCMTSNYEGLGMVLIEASRYGCIPMAFNSYASIHDIIEDQVNGRIIKKFDMNKYINALQELMINQNLREKLRKGALQIHRKFDLNIITDQWINLFEKLHKHGLDYPPNN
jgi:glycosyltransferase involved in cell wall biosynthesis